MSKPNIRQAVAPCKCGHDPGRGWHDDRRKRERLAILAEMSGPNETRNWRESLRRNLKWTQGEFLLCTVLLLGYCAYARVDSWIFHQRDGQDLDRRLRSQPAAREAIKPAVETDSLIGRIELPRLSLSVVVVEGVGRATLRRAVGLFPAPLCRTPRQRGLGRSPGHILPPAGECEDQGRNWMINA